MPLPSLHLKPGREKSLLNRHPWIFSGAIDKIRGEPDTGATVAVLASDGRPLGLAAYSPHSQIRARLWTTDADAFIGTEWFQQRVAAAVARRGTLAAQSGVRLIHGESDGLPGLVVDRYDRTLVVQFAAAGVEAWRETILDALVAATGCEDVFERSDVEVRTLEGLQPQIGVLRGKPAATATIVENGLRYEVDVARGQKTGFYLDQRANRLRVRERIAQLAAPTVLNCFCYTGGFSLAALAGGAAQVMSIDSSGEALALAQANAAANADVLAGAADRAEWIEADVFQYLRRLRDMNRQFDFIVLDPPKFAPTAQHVAKASRAYKDINLWAFKLLKPNGYLATFTCSGGMTAELFQKIVAGAAVDARVDAQIVERFTADDDHPVSLHFPEGDYLKGLLVRKV